MIAIYARYSSDLQNDQSIIDQIEVCRKLINQRGFQESGLPIEVYADRALSDASMSQRTEMLRLGNEIEGGQVTIVVTEGLGRISRDQEDIAQFYKIAKYHGVPIHTCLEGLISRNNIGMNDTVRTLQLDQQAERSRRGQAGNIRAGKAAGSLPYGYKIRYLNDNGVFEAGLRDINPDEAKIVERIYTEFIAGKSYLDIAKDLNIDRIPSPRGGFWAGTTISGQHGYGNGILQNPIYKGDMIWNRHNFDQHPVTGVRHVRANDEKDWVVHHNPELRIISDARWEHVQNIIEERRPKHTRSSTTAIRQKYPDIGIKVICGRCGTQMNKHSSQYLICGQWKRSRSCTHSKKINTQKLVDALYDYLHKSFDTIWPIWQSLAADENIRREEKRQKKTFLQQEILTLDEISRDVLFNSVKAARHDHIGFTHRILNTVTIEKDDSGIFLISETEPDWDELVNL